MGAACVTGVSDASESTADRPSQKHRHASLASSRRRQSSDQSPSLPSHRSSNAMEESNNLTFADSSERLPRPYPVDLNANGVDAHFTFPVTPKVHSAAGCGEDQDSNVSAESAAALDGALAKPAPLTAEDEDMLCYRDDDPPIIDDEPPTFNPTALFHSNAARHVHRRTLPNAPSLCYSARKSTVSFSESVSVHYDNPAQDEEDCDDVDERGTMTMHFDLEDEDELHPPPSAASQAGNDAPPPPLVTVVSPPPAARPPLLSTSTVSLCGNPQNAPHHSPSGDMVASPGVPFAMSGATFSSARNHQRTGTQQSDDASSVSALLLQPTIFSDVSSVASSRGTVVTVRLGTDSASHREQRARPRI